MALVEKHHGDVGSLQRNAGAGEDRGFRLSRGVVAPLAIAAAICFAALSHGVWLGAVWTLATLLAWFFVRGAAVAADEESEPRARHEL